MIRYLLDELYTYEQDHSNALRPSHCTGSESTGALLPHIDENRVSIAPMTAAESRKMFTVQAEFAGRLENQLNKIQKEYSYLSSKITGIGSGSFGISTGLVCFIP